MQVLFRAEAAPGVSVFKTQAQDHGIDAALMKKAVAQLTEDDMIAISAYLGTQGPK